MEQPPLTAPTPITQSRRVVIAEIEALQLENRKLQDPALPEYVLLWGASAKRLGITVEQTINIALLHRDFDETLGAAMPPDMCEAFIEYAEGRALARVAESKPQVPSAISNVIAFRKRETLS